MANKNWCPFSKGKCKEAECKFWSHMIGKNPQSNETLDKFDCAITFLPILLVENAQMSRQMAASVSSFRNGVVEGIKQVAVISHNSAKGLLDAKPT